MISVKTNAPVEYYIVYAFNDEQEIIFGATEKNLPATIEKAVTGRENDIYDLFGGRRTVGSLMIDFAEFKGFPAIMIENLYALYINIHQSIPLVKAESVAKDFSKQIKSSINAFYSLLLCTIWNVFRIDKHLSASRLFNLKPLETCAKYAEEFRDYYKNLLSINEKNKLSQNSSAITVTQEYDYTVIYGKAKDFEAIYAEYVAELKKRKIYCRSCKGCNKIMLFYKKNKLLCDTCTAANIAHSKKEHKLVENSDKVLSTNKINLRNMYNYLHSAALRNSSPEHQQWFAKLFAEYKATAKVLMKQYRDEEVSKSDALAELKKMSDEFFKRTGRRV